MAPAVVPKNSTNGRKKDPLQDPRLKLLRQAFAWSTKVSTTLTAKAALRLFLTPKRHRRPEREEEVLARGIPLLGLERVAAWQWGQGPVVLLVHGWEGRGAQLGAFVDPLLEAGYQVVAFDARAHGVSPGSQATLLDFAQDIEAVAAQVGPLHGVIAHSFGCAGATLALSRGLVVRAAVFIAPPVRLADGAQAFGDALGLTPEVRATMQAIIERRVGITWDEVDGARLARERDTPLLVLHDREDREVPWAAGAELAHAWPRATLLSTSGLGHRRILRDPGVVSAAVQVIDAMAPDPRQSSDLDRELDALFEIQRSPHRARPRAALVLSPALQAAAATAS